MNGYDTVFANAKDEELEFETMFDQEDDLIDTIVGCNECGDPLTGADPCPVKTADERSSSDDNPDYEKDIDGCDTNAPSDAEGTVGYDFETKPEIGSKSDETVPTVEPVEGEDQYQDKKDTDAGVEDTVTGTIDNNKDIEEGFDFYLEEDDETASEDDATEPVDDKCNEEFDFSLDEADELGYEETDTEEERITDAPLVTPKDIEDTAKEVSEGFDFYLEDDEEVVKNSDAGVEDTVTGTIENDKDVEEGFDFSLDEADDPLNGQDTNPNVNAKERSCDDCDIDYEDIDGKDTNAPKDAEGTVGYDFETKPEIGSKSDESTVDAKDVKIEEDVDFEFSTIIPNDVEGTVGYDFEVNPEIGSKSDESTVDAKDVKVEEGFNFYLEEDEESEEEPTEPVDDCNEGFDFSLNEADEVPGIDKDVQSIENGETYLDDDAIEDAESKDPDIDLNYDISDEEVIDFVMNN